MTGIDPSVMKGVFPDWFVAFFYTGLGCALALAGVLFIRNYVASRKK